jgi:transcriptional regulator with XRE-family HTH domain
MKRKTVKGRRPTSAGRPAAALIKLFSTRFAAWRKSKGLRLKDVAADLDVSISIVAEWENGHRFPSIDHLQAIAKYTKIPVWRLLKP